MKYVYLDESVSQNGNYIGYGALFLSDERFAEQIIDKALSDLKNDPDRKQVQCEEMDNRTINRKYFHACDDSKNSHSHLCTSINVLMQGEFNSQVYNKSNMPYEESSNEYLFDLTSGLSSLRMYETREPITIVFEERNGLTKEKIEGWLERYTKGVVASVYDNPYIPALFPEVNIEISNKSNKGLQCCDYILWAVMRKLQGNDTWYNRLNPRFKTESQPENNEWLAVDMVFGRIKEEDNVSYKLEDYPIDPDSIISNNDLVRFYLYAEKLLLHLNENGVPAHLKYMEGDIKNLADNVLDKKDINRVEKVAGIYIRLFDTLPVISPESDSNNREFLLLSKKYMALVLRNDLINGVRTRMFLENECRKNLEFNPQWIML